MNNTTGTSTSNQLLKSTADYPKVSDDYYNVDAECERCKRKLDLVLAAQTGLMEGSSVTERKMNALRSEAYIKANKEYIEAYRKKNEMKGKKEQIELQFKVHQSILSYERALVEKGIYSPYLINQNDRS